MAEEQEIRDMFERFGRVTRVFLARDRETQRAKGFAFISFADRADAASACDKMDGCMCSCFVTWRPRVTDIFQLAIATLFSASSSQRGLLRSASIPLRGTLDSVFFHGLFMVEVFLCIVWAD